MNNSEIFEKMRRLMPGGVNSPVRAFRSVGGTPVVMRHGEGCRLTDVDGGEYIDMVGSWGPLILGHNHPAVRAAVAEAVTRGLSFGTPCESEADLAELVVESVPGIDLVRLVNSGTEATMSAIRLARAATGRDYIVKVIGGYHGHADPFLVQAGSGAATAGIPTSPGVPAATAGRTLVVRYNDPDGLERLFAQRGSEIACLILEPVPGNMGLVIPQPDYLDRVSEIVHSHGALLVFDEVITGFRTSLGGAQERYGVIPDITALGKIIGGGMPVGAFGGPREIMKRLAPEGPVYQAGTLSGNPVTMAAGTAALRELRKPGFYEDLEEKSAYFFGRLTDLCRTTRIESCANSIASMGTLFFTGGPVTDYQSASRSDTARYAAWFHGMLERGIYVAPGKFECMFVSAAHSIADLDVVLQAAEETLRGMESTAP